MSSVPYKVFVVVDREFGEGLSDQEQGVPAWIVDTPINKPVVERFWKERPDEGHLTGITTFKDAALLSAEDESLSQLDAIELHHGVYSADPPCTVLEIFGTQLTDNAKNVLSEDGFDKFQITSTGFATSRPKALNPN